MAGTEVISDFNSIAVKFNDVTHLRIMRSRLVGFQSWKVSEREFHIEITLDGGVIRTEYDDRDKWTAIIDGLDRHF